jgi:hypothetical protein
MPPRLLPLLSCRLSGKLLHIDFGDCFEASMNRDKFPEKVRADVQAAGDLISWRLWPSPTGYRSAVTSCLTVGATTTCGMIADASPFPLARLTSLSVVVRHPPVRFRSALRA